MAPRKTPDARRLHSVLLGGALFLGAGLWGGAVSCRAGECPQCPPPYVHCMEQPPRVKFKGVCPKPVCPPCDEDFWGYYPTGWRRWPAPYPNCPQQSPAWLTAAPACHAQPSLFPPGGTPPAPAMPAAKGQEAQPGDPGKLPSAVVPAPRSSLEGGPRPVPISAQERLSSDVDKAPPTASPATAPEEEEMEDTPLQQPTPVFRQGGIRPAPAGPPAQPGTGPML